MPAAQFRARVVENHQLTGGYFRLELEAESPTPIDATRPGQFVMLRGDWGRDLINGRAFSVLHAVDDRRFSVLAKVFGRGTALLSEMRSGDGLTCTGPLGTGFPEPVDGETQLLVAGGVGLPPVHLQAREASAAGHPERVEMFYGGRGSEDLVLLDELEGFGVKTTLATEDGSVGTRGFVTVPLQARIDAAKQAGEAVRLLACGPTPMLESVREIGLSQGIPAHICLEEQMACGYGVCLGCAVPVYGPKPYKYCCSDGPVFDAREVRWS